MTRELQDTVAIVTGASRGIGKGLAIGLASAGAAVVCAARTLEPSTNNLPGSLHETVAAITADGGRALAVRCDIGVADDIAELVTGTVDAFGRVDVLVNNAMAPTRGSFDETTIEMWDESMRVNVRSLFLTTKAVVPHMQRTGGGSIVNISSGGAGHESTPFMPAGFATYAVAKAAMERFSTILAPELAAKNVAINALRPGAVRTELATLELGDDHDWSGWTTPQAVVPAVLHLGRQRGDGLTGRVLESTRYGTTWP